jgi:hypothetical protein
MVGRGLAPGTQIGPRQSHRHAMDVNEALEAWQAQYSGQPPVGFMLRFTHEAVWTRIHYLHQGFEPRTVGDARRMAAHFDAICTALFSGATVLVTAIQFEPSVEESAALRAAGARPITPPSGWLESLEDYISDPGRAECAASTIAWRRGCLNDLWFAVARDRIERLAVFSPATGDAFCPYPGGADIFVWGSERRLQLGSRFEARQRMAPPIPLYPRRSGRAVADRG